MDIESELENKVIDLESRIKLLEHAVKQEQEEKYNAYKRITELNKQLTQQDF